MDSNRARSTGWCLALAFVGMSGFFAVCRGRPAQAQNPPSAAESENATVSIRDVHSPHCLLHTDLSPCESDVLVERLETMLKIVSNYWARPMRGVLECHVVRNLDDYPMECMAPLGIRKVKMAGGATLMQMSFEGNRRVLKSVVVASTRPEVVYHEAIHAYCFQTFGHIGPVWYSEGMAEMGHYWKEGDVSVRADPREIEFLRAWQPKSIAELVAAKQVSGDSWQNYAKRWSLCHFLVFNPTYAKQFRQLGQGFLAGKDVGFDRTFGAVLRPLFFDYLFFLNHIDQGYRVDLCAWDWSKKFISLQPGRVQTATISAGLGWQPTGLAIRAGTQYDYLAAGTWRVAGSPEAMDAGGDNQGRGRLVGVLMKDCQLGDEFELGPQGLLDLKSEGDLYLRCRNDWNRLAGDCGRIAVNFKLSGQGPPLQEPEAKDSDTQ